MSIRIRIIDLRRTFVVRAYSRSTNRSSMHIWVAIHPRERDWAAVFQNALDLLMETSSLGQQRIDFAQGSGQITWRRTAFWTIIRLNVMAFSKKKRQLIGAALLKSARYAD